MRPLLLDQKPEAWDLGPGPAFRRAQVSDWIFQKRAASTAEMSNLPQALRSHLDATLERQRICAARDRCLDRYRSG